MPDWARKSSLYLLLAALLLAVLWKGAYFPGEKWVFAWLLIAAGALELGLGAYERRVQLPRAPAFWLLTVFTVFGAASLFWSVSPVDTERESVFMLGLLAAFFVAQSHLRREGPPALVSISIWLAYAAGFTSALGVISFITRTPAYTELLDGIYRASSTFEYSNALSCFGLMALPVTAALFHQSARQNRPLIAVAMSLQSAAVLLTYARFGLVALVILSIYLLAEGWRRGTALSVALALAGGVVAALAATLMADAGQGAGGIRGSALLIAGILVEVLMMAGVWLLVKLVEPVGKESGCDRTLPVAKLAAGAAGAAVLAAALLAGASARFRVIIATRFEDGFTLSRLLPARLDTYQGAIDAFRVRPLAGSGLGSFPRVYQQYAIAVYTKYAHNLVLETAVDTGLAGAALLAAFLAYAVALSLWRLFIRASPLGRAFAITTLVFAAYNMFDWEWYIPALTAWFVVGLACLESGAAPPAGDAAGGSAGAGTPPAATNPGTPPLCGTNPVCHNLASRCYLASRSAVTNAM